MRRASIVLTLLIIAFWVTSKVCMIGIGIALPIRSSLAFASDSGFVGFGITSSGLIRANPFNLMVAKVDSRHTIYNEMQAHAGGIGWEWKGGVDVVVLRWLYILLLPSGLWVESLRRRHRLIAAPNRCPTCGYDLRATPDRCPECGTIAPTVVFSDAVTPG